MEFLHEDPIRGVYLRDFGVTGGRARPGFIGLRHSERLALEPPLKAAA